MTGAPALVVALGTILPTPEQTWLLRALLHEGDAGRAAWERWCALVGDPKEAIAGDRGGVKRLVPLLYTALRRNGATVDPALVPYLRAIYAREVMRTGTYQRILAETVGVLADAGVPCTLLRGGAMCTTVYDDPALRHCHDISLLVDPADLARAADVLAAHGLTRTGAARAIGVPVASVSDVFLRHESTLPVELHTRLFEMPLYDLPASETSRRLRRVRVGARDALVLAPTDALLHLCGHASYAPSRGTMRWLSDAWHLLRRHPDLDWALLLESARRARLVVPLAVMLRYLAEELDAAMPADVLAAVLAASARASGIERDVALRGARADLATGGDAGIGALLRRTPGGWAVRARVFGWLLFPSPRYVEETAGVRGAGRVSAEYLFRLARLGRAGVRGTASGASTSRTGSATNS